MDKVPDISAIVPTVGRAEQLGSLLESLIGQHVSEPLEVVVADSSEGEETLHVVRDPRWEEFGLRVAHVKVTPPNAVRQRIAAIQKSSGARLLFLDDDIVVEGGCVSRMSQYLDEDAGIVAVTATITNQPWPRPTRLWSLYIRYILGIREGGWQGQVLGPLLRFGYNPTPAAASPMQWLGTGNSMVRRDAFLAAGGFSDFFLHRCTTNEDVDLGLKLRTRGRIVLAPDCRVSHHHAPTGRVSTRIAAEDDAFNRFMILSRTLRYPYWRVLRLMVVYVGVETMSDLWSIARRLRMGSAFERIAGRLSGFRMALLGRAE